MIFLAKEILKFLRKIMVSLKADHCNYSPLVTKNLATHWWQDFAMISAVHNSQFVNMRNYSLDWNCEDCTKYGFVFVEFLGQF